MEKTKDALEQAIGALIDPEAGKTLAQENALEHLGIDPEKDLVVLLLSIKKTGGTTEHTLRRDIARIVKIEAGFAGLKIEFEEKRKLDSIANRAVHFILVASGKGGVGKSTVAANLSYALARKGKVTALVDADVYGSSLPRMLELPITPPAGNAEGKVIPFQAFGMETMSTAFFVDAGKPVIWRGAMLNSMMDEFFYDVAWNPKTEYLIVDMPPGTGDIALDMRTILPDADELIVTTPHIAASDVAVKAGFCAQQLHHGILGVVENLSYWINPEDATHVAIFGEGGGARVAEGLDVELLAQVPIGQPKHHLSLYETDEVQGKIFDDLADIVIFKTTDGEED